jgi:transcription factor IIIB subunit 2
MKCSNPACPNPDIIESEQGLICDTCGAVAQEESGLVSEQGFGETESGRITALGVHVGESQTHQRTYAPGGALGNAGREPTVNRDRSEAHARTVMLSYQPLLGVRMSEIDAGMQIFKLAWGNSFVQGRTIDSVAVVCLYLACRRKHEQVRNERRPMYSLMLIDFAEKLNIDVFALGKMYSDLVRKLYLQPDGSIQGDVSADLLAMGPEILVNRFVDELEFDKEHRDKIKIDAIRIVQRMKRDWMSTGRRPSGVCGAAVILAARMNNYRRTTREVVLTAKVTEITINKRLEEFQNTAGSKLSVVQFRDNQVLDSLVAADPPSYQRAHNPQVKKKRGRPRKYPVAETAAEIEGDTTTPGPPPNVQGTTAGDGEPPAKRVRIDADGYKIPEIPNRQPLVDSTPPAAVEGTQDASQDEDAEASPARTRAPNWKAPPVSPAELAIENEIEHDVLEALGELDPTGSDSTRQQPQAESQPDTAAAPTSSPEVVAPPTPASTGKDKTPGPAVNTNAGNLGHVSLSPTLRADEFDSDDDVSTCLLTEEETRVKERVWVSMNADWLRQDHVKRIKRELHEADMRARGLDPAKEALKQLQAKGKRKDGTKKPGRRGDVSYLNERDDGRKDGIVEGGDGDADATKAEDGAPLTRADRERSAAESVRKMFKTRGVYSRRVNYDVLDSIYGVGGGGGDNSDNNSVSRSRSQSVASVASELPQNARESSVASMASVASTAVSVSGGIFRGNGGRESGRQRSRASLAAERREKNRKLQQQRQLSESATRSVSRSRSPNTPAPAAGGGGGGGGGGDENAGEALPNDQDKNQGSNVEPEAEVEAEIGPRDQQPQQQPTPPLSQSQNRPPPVAVTTAAASRPVGIPTVKLSSSAPGVPENPGVEALVTPSSSASQAQANQPTGNDGADDDREEVQQTDRGFDDGDDDDDDDEVEEPEDDDPDDYVRGDEEEDVDAAFEGRYASRGW